MKSKKSKKTKCFGLRLHNKHFSLLTQRFHDQDLEKKYNNYELQSKKNMLILVFLYMFMNDFFADIPVFNDLQEDK